ncbi:MAG: SH3 domain-containing protein [Anaerolineae bacterium]|nr:SH3 domain-containing protein [Anaerolineae bacterium]
MANFLATILGNPEFPSIREVNVRSGPAITRELLFKIPLGAKSLVKACATDADGSAKTGKLYTWLHLDFQDGRTGWVRDDLIEVEGDGAEFGYGFVPQRQQAFKLVRTVVIDTPVTPPDPAATPVTPTPVVIVPPVTPPTPDTIATASAAITMGRDGVNVRRGPGTSHEAVTRFPHRTRCEILGAKPEDNRASRFKWVQVRANNTSGWVREDYLRYEGDVSGFGLAFADAYPSPIQNSFWVRDWNTDPNYTAIHYGWDLGAATGEPIFAGPGGGLVIQVNRCTLCTPDRPSVLQNGLRLNDPGVLQNPAWGYGYGNYVVVRYLYDLLPASTKAELARRNLPNYHLFTIYAHLNTIEVSQGQTVEPNQRIATCGNSGNSEAAHLHLEIRAWNNAAETSTGRMISNRMDPVVLFRR